MMNMMKLNHRYSVPMSLWLVVVTQRISRRLAVVVTVRGRDRAVGVAVVV